MRQFDVLRNPSKSSQGRRPLLLVLQHDFVANTETVLVAPLARAGQVPLLTKLFVHFEVNGKAHLMITSELAPIVRSLLGKPVSNLAHERDAIKSALDFVFHGF